MEQLQQLINAKPETHPTDCVSRATKHQPGTLCFRPRARFESLMDGKTGGNERETDRNSGLRAAINGVPLRGEKRGEKRNGTSMCNDQRNPDRVHEKFVPTFARVFLGFSVSSDFGNLSAFFVEVQF